METGSDFASAVGAWHDFFAAVAGLAGTLIGLLFVSLSLSPRLFGKRGPAGIRAWAAQTFHSLLVLLVVGLVALVPMERPGALAATFLVVGVQGFARVALDLWRGRGDPDWGGAGAIGRILSPALAYAASLWLAVELRGGSAEALGWSVAVVFLLLMSAAASCWDLLEAVGDRGDDAAGA